jgi:hypothetical protein
MFDLPICRAPRQVESFAFGIPPKDSDIFAPLPFQQPESGEKPALAKPNEVQAKRR